LIFFETINDTSQLISQNFPGLIVSLANTWCLCWWYSVKSIMSLPGGWYH